MNLEAIPSNIHVGIQTTLANIQLFFERWCASRGKSGFVKESLFVGCNRDFVPPENRVPATGTGIIEMPGISVSL